MEKRIGYGTKFFIGATLIGGLTDITPPSPERASVQVTDMDSPDNGHHEFIPGLVDGGEVSLDFHLDPSITSPSNQFLLRENLEQGANVSLASFSIEFVNGVTVTWNGFVTGFEPAVPLEDTMTGSCTIKVSGKATWGTSPIT